MAKEAHLRGRKWSGISWMLRRRRARPCWSDGPDARDRLSRRSTLYIEIGMLKLPSVIDFVPPPGRLNTAENVPVAEAPFRTPGWVTATVQLWVVGSDPPSASLYVRLTP